jgi:hypothetical protein
MIYIPVFNETSIFDFRPEIFKQLKVFSQINTNS